MQDQIEDGAQAAAGNAAESVREKLSSFADGTESTGAPLGEDPKNPGRDDKVNRMGTESIPKLITEFAIPSIVGMIVNGAYNVIDSIFLGQAMHEVGQAAMTAANPIMILFMAIAMLIGNGGNALAALRLGEGDRVGAEISLGNTVVLSVIVSGVVALLAFIPPCIDTLLTISGTTPEVWEHTKHFLQIISVGFFLQCIGLGVNNFIRTAGNPNRALGTMIIGTIVCIFFNYLFVLKLGWGIEGSAVATVIGWAASCICVLWFFIKTKNVPLKLHLRYMPLKARTVRLIFSLGFASFAIQAGAAVVNFVLNNMLVKYGAASAIGQEGALASIGVVSRIAMFTIFPLVGVAVAIQPLLGYNYGAHLFKRVKTILWQGIAGSTVIATLMWAAVHIWPSQIVGVFGLEDAQLVDFTIFALKVQLALLPFIAFQIVGSNYFQATGQPAKSAFLSLTRQVLFLIPLYLVLPQILPSIVPSLTSLDAVYFGPPIADFFAIFTTVIFLVFEMRRMKKLESGEIEVSFQ